jgi:hypothetical protein
MASVLASSAVDCGFEPRSGQIKDYEIGICCFSAEYAALRRKSKEWLLGIRIIEQVNFQQDDDEGLFVLDQHA